MSVSLHAAYWGWCALLVVAGLPEMFAEHQRRGNSQEVSQATAVNLARWIGDYREKRNHRPEFPPSWFRNHLNYGFLKLESIQFLPGTFGGAVHVYFRSDRFSAPIALASNGISCSANGWPGTGVDGFLTTLSKSATEATGYPVDADTGQYLRTPLVLDRAQWNLRLSPGDHVLDVHIPSAASPIPEKCQIAFAVAAEVFGRCFPEIAWRAFTCISWLLDRELRHGLSSTSKTLRFGAGFYPFPPKETKGHQLMESVFNNTTNWQSFPARTSLQKAAHAQLFKGEAFWTTSGDCLRENAWH